MERLPRLHPPFDNEDRQRLYAAITSGPRGGSQQPFALVDDVGALAGPFNAMLLQPGLGAALQALGAAIRYQGTLPARLRELAILVVAGHWSSAFEQHAHEAAGRRAGLSEAELAAVRAGEEPALADPAERAAVRAVRALVRAATWTTRRTPRPWPSWVRPGCSSSPPWSATTPRWPSSSGCSGVGAFPPQPGAFQLIVDFVI